MTTITVTREVDDRDVDAYLQPRTDVVVEEADGRRRAGAVVPDGRGALPRLPAPGRGGVRRQGSGHRHPDDDVPPGHRAVDGGVPAAHAGRVPASGRADALVGAAPDPRPRGHGVAGVAGQPVGGGRLPRHADHPDHHLRRRRVRGQRPHPGRHARRRAHRRPAVHAGRRLGRPPRSAARPAVVRRRGRRLHVPRCAGPGDACARSSRRSWPGACPPRSRC